MECPRCQSQAELLIAIDSFQYRYKGPLTSVCAKCRDQMLVTGDLVPSSSAEKWARLRRHVRQQHGEIGRVRRRLLAWAIAAAAAVLVAIALWWGLGN